tara:strand:+ start:707 stop:1750 length:1044 start_codon:yes stop_codon:yes gene_type:complete
MDSLHRDGFVVLRNVLDPLAVKMAQQNINSKVNYSQIKTFIDQNMMKKINDILQLDLVNIKYRVSNNNNSSDAASFHRDLHSYYPNEVTPVFTCLTYLDTAFMELIPQTFQNISSTIPTIIKLWKGRRTIQMNPGDILVFYATTIHRGVFYHKITKNGNRRLIQLFDCVPRNKLDFFLESILHIPCLNNCNNKIANFLIQINKNKMMSKISNTVTSLIAFRGYGAKYRALPFITSDRKIRYLSTESNRKRLAKVYQNKFLESNCYILNTESSLVRDTTIRQRRNYEFVSFYLYLVEIILLVIVIVVIFKMLPKQKNKLTHQKNKNKLANQKNKLTHQKKKIKNNIKK